MKTNESAVSAPQLPAWLQTPILGKANFLEGWRVDYFRTAEEVILAWESADKIEVRLGILHGLTLGSFSGNARIARFLLRVACGNQSCGQVRFLSNSHEEMCALLAKKAFSVLATVYLKVTPDANGWFWVLSQPEVIADILDFCLDSDGTATYRNWDQHPEYRATVSADTHNQKIFRDFLEMLVSAVWNFERSSWFQGLVNRSEQEWNFSGNKSEKAKAMAEAKQKLKDLRKSFLGFRPRILDLITCLGGLDRFESLKWDLDGDSRKRLTEMAFREDYFPSYNLGFSDQKRKPANLGEATLVSPVATVLLVRKARERAVQEIEAKLKLKQEEAKEREREEKIRKLKAQEEKLKSDMAKLLDPKGTV